MAWPGRTLFERGFWKVDEGAPAREMEVLDEHDPAHGMDVDDGMLEDETEPMMMSMQSSMRMMSTSAFGTDHPNTSNAFHHEGMSAMEMVDVDVDVLRWQRVVWAGARLTRCVQGFVWTGAREWAVEGALAEKVMVWNEEARRAKEEEEHRRMMTRKWAAAAAATQWMWMKTTKRKRYRVRTMM
jgi:protein SMG6